MLDNVYGIDKENFETYVDETGLTVITDAQWEQVRNEIEGRVENFLDELLQLLAEDYLDGEFDEE